VILFYFAFCVLFLALLITEQDQATRPRSRRLYRWGRYR